MSEYTPTEADVRGIYVEYYMRHTGRLHSHTEAEFDAWLARVRRDAERDAVLRLRDHLAESCGYNLIGPEGLDHYIRREHPEEAA